MLKHFFLNALFGVCFLSLTVVENPAQSLLKNDKIPDDLVITLERTTCFGSCPEYALTITNDGYVHFIGSRFTKTEGLAKGNITEDQLREIIAEFEKVGFFKLKKSYRTESDGCQALATDLPSETIYIQINGKTKRVDHYLGCLQVKGNPTEMITALGRKIDEITNSKFWITGTD